MPRTEHSEVLSKALQSIAAGNVIEAELLLSNFYYRKARNNDYVTLLATLVTMSAQKGHSEVDENQVLLQLLYHLDRRKVGTGAIRIIYDAAAQEFHYRIQKG